MSQTAGESRQTSKWKTDTGVSSVLLEGPAGRSSSCAWGLRGTVEQGIYKAPSVFTLKLPTIRSPITSVLGRQMVSLRWEQYHKHRNHWHGYWAALWRTWDEVEDRVCHLMLPKPRAFVRRPSSPAPAFSHGDTQEGSAQQGKAAGKAGPPCPVAPGLSFPSFFTSCLGGMGWVWGCFFFGRVLSSRRNGASACALTHF